MMSTATVGHSGKAECVCSPSAMISGSLQTVRTRPNVLSFEAMIPFGSDAISSSGRLGAPQRLRAQYRTRPTTAPPVFGRIAVFAVLDIGLDHHEPPAVERELRIACGDVFDAQQPDILAQLAVQWLENHVASPCFAIEHKVRRQHRGARNWKTLRCKPLELLELGHRVAGMHCSAFRFELEQRAYGEHQRRALDLPTRGDGVGRAVGCDPHLDIGCSCFDPLFHLQPVGKALEGRRMHDQKVSGRLGSEARGRT
jgi:hypothetical protein